MDAVGGELGPERLEQPPHRELGRRVGRVAVDADEPDIGGDPDDRSRSPLDHAGDDLADGPQRAEVVDVDHLAEDGVGQLLEVARAGHAGAADQDVDRAPIGRDLGEGVAHGVAVGHVELERGGVAPALSSSATAAWSGSGRRATTVMRAPLAASAIAVARPMPLEPPVISAWRPAMLVIGPTLEPRHAARPIFSRGRRSPAARRCGRRRSRARRASTSSVCWPTVGAIVGTGSSSSSSLTGRTAAVGAEPVGGDPAAAGPGTAGRRRWSVACSPVRWSCCAARRTSTHSARRPGAEDVASARRAARRLPRAWSAYLLPGHFSKRSVRPTPSQKFFQNSLLGRHEQHVAVGRLVDLVAHALLHARGARRAALVVVATCCR